MKDELKLYVTHNCPGCDRVLKLLPECKQAVTVIHLDEGMDPRAPENLMVVPALYVGSEMVALGADIIRYLRKAA